MGTLLLAIKLIVVLLVLVVLFVIWGLCKAASERGRTEEEAERKKYQ